MGKVRTIVIVFISIIVIGFIALVVWAWYDNMVDSERRDEQAHLARGCEPKAWNSWGWPTIWSCPVR